MRVIDQAAVDAVPRHANGRRYMPRGIYAAGVVTGDWCSFPEGCIFRHNTFGELCDFYGNSCFAGCVFGRGCSIGRGCKFERCRLGDYCTVGQRAILHGCSLGEGRRVWSNGKMRLVVIGAELEVRAAAEKRSEQMSMWSEN